MEVKLSSRLTRQKRSFDPHWLWGLIPLALALLLLWPGVIFHRSLPDFEKIHDISERKAAFFEFLSPYIHAANREILRDRSHLRAIEKRFQLGPLNRRDRHWILDTAEAFGMELDPEADLSMEQLEELRLRLDIIPPSLALAQAALESGWGTSRYAQQGNNLFGIWCYEPGCGIIPRRRPAGATYEVASYRSPRNSFLDYIWNLNSNTAYRQLWLLRQNLRQNGDPIEGVVLADGLMRYSEEGSTYIRKIKGVIQSNGLGRFDP